jgi:transposase-like protein
MQANIGKWVEMKAWLDVSVLRCPNCGRYYVEASWYVVKMESDIECGKCGKEFNSKRNALDRALLEFHLNENGKIQNVAISKHLELENK